MRPVPISPKTFFKKKVASGTGGYLVYTKKKFASEDSFVFLCLSPTADPVEILRKLMKMLIKQILGYLMPHEGLLCRRDAITIIDKSLSRKCQTIKQKSGLFFYQNIYIYTDLTKLVFLID